MAGEPTELARERLEVRVFTLADHVATPPDGKLYISGGGVDRIFVPQLPGPLGQLWLAMRIRLPWHMTSDRLTVTIRALDGDRNVVGPDPVAQAELEVGRAPGQRPGDEVAVQLAIPLTGFPVSAEGVLYFHLIVNDEQLTSLPLRVVHRSPVPGPPA